MLIKLERDRVVSRVTSLEAQVRQMEAAGKVDAEDTGRCAATWFSQRYPYPYPFPYPYPYPYP